MHLSLLSVGIYLCSLFSSLILNLAFIFIKWNFIGYQQVLDSD